MVTYASYVREGERLPRAALLIVAGDTLFALGAGVAIFPAVFAFGLDPTQGAALAFVTLPISPFSTLVSDQSVGTSSMNWKGPGCFA